MSKVPSLNITAFKISLFTLFLLFSHAVLAETQGLKGENIEGRGDLLFHYNFVDVFLRERLYDGGYSYQALLKKGNFGLAAADKIDGEITILDGKIYQTKANGKTVNVSLQEKTALAFVSDFSADFQWEINAITSKEKLEAILLEQIQADHYIYAIKIKGDFRGIKARTFPAVTTKPYAHFSESMKNQVFFNYQNISGTLVGFFIPSFLKGVNNPGFHFHFISDNRQYSGHLLALDIISAKIEVDMLNGYEVLFPTN